MALTPLAGRFFWRSHLRVFVFKNCSFNENFQELRRKDSSSRFRSVAPGQGFLEQVVARYPELTARDRAKFKSQVPSQAYSRHGLSDTLVRPEVRWCFEIGHGWVMLCGNKKVYMSWQHMHTICCDTPQPFALFIADLWRSRLLSETYEPFGSPKLGILGIISQTFINITNITII